MIKQLDFTCIRIFIFSLAQEENDKFSGNMQKLCQNIKEFKAIVFLKTYDAPIKRFFFLFKFKKMTFYLNKEF